MTDLPPPSRMEERQWSEEEPGSEPSRSEVSKMSSTMKLDFDFDNAWSEKDRSLPTFLRQRGVKGSLRFRNLKGEQAEKVKLVLRGHMFNMIGHGCSALYQPHRVQLEQRFLRMTDVQDVVSSSPASRGLEDQKFVFEFQISKAMPDMVVATDTSNAPLSGSLPCSLGIFGPWCTHAAGQACCQAEALVKYEVEATVYSGDDVVAREHRAIRIFDCPDANPPPVHVEHFPEEYTMKQIQPLKAIYKLSQPKLEILAFEPKPVEVRPAGDVSFGGFPIRLVVRNCDAVPKKLDIRVNSLLKAITFVSSTKMDGQPSAKQAKHNPFLAAVPKWGRSYHRKLRITHWTRGTRPGEWIAHALVWMPVSEGATPAPTFFTPYLARRYSVSLRLEIKGAGKAIFNLLVPIQIVYPDGCTDAPSYESATSTPSSDFEDFDFPQVDELPLYVR